jgi:hypothetical protein
MDTSGCNHELHIVEPEELLTIPAVADEDHGIKRKSSESSGIPPSKKYKFIPIAERQRTIESDVETQSDKLSARHTRDGGGLSINTQEAKQHDNSVKNVMKDVRKQCAKKYPDHKWSIKRQILLTEIAKLVTSEHIPSNIRSNIQPDGGILYRDETPILVIEAKKQGTNNTRQSKGLKKQAKGNAIERAAKNNNELKNLFIRDKYFPYIIFCYGCDFREGSSIVDRLSAMTYYDKFNTLHIKDTFVEIDSSSVDIPAILTSADTPMKNVVLERRKKTSIFVQEEPYNHQFIYDKCLEAVEIVLSLL